jgi:protein-S-isoprenylcysteine O-methyltransferase Ste14
VTYIVWILSEILLNRLVRSGNADKKAADKHTELFLWLTVVFSITAGVFTAIKTSFPVFGNPQYTYIGIVVIVIGIIFRFIAIRQLGRFFTVDVTIREGHELMQRGLYKYLRHPSYAGSLLSFLGFGLSINNWLSMVVVILPYFLAMYVRMNLEEKVLTEQFGQQYSNYMSKTKRLIPFIY